MRSDGAEPAEGQKRPSGGPAGGATGIWVGGYTADMGGSAEGIGLLRINPDGDLEFAGLVASTPSPSFLARAGDVLYAAGESGPTVSAFRITGAALDPIGTEIAAGTFPCSLAVMTGGSILLVASYGDGAVGLHELDGNGPLRGRPGPVAQVLHDLTPTVGPHDAQDGSHAHDALQWDSATVLTTDLGTDRVHIHSLTPASAPFTSASIIRDSPGSSRLARTGSVRLPAGSGPRDLWRHPSGRVWVLAELGCEVFVLERNESRFAVVGRCALPGAQHGDHAAAIAVGTDGRFAYAGLRGSDRVAVLRVRDGDGVPEPVTSVPSGGNGPRHLVIVGDWLYVANQFSSSVSRLRIGADGIPVLVDSVDVPSPTYLLVDDGSASARPAESL